MRHAICLEEMEGRWIAHAPALPGCFASADARDTAQALAPQAIHDYLSWRLAHGDRSVSHEALIEIHVDEVGREWALPDNPDYVVNAFFTADVAPLTAQDIRQAQQLLAWTRADLLAAADGLSPEALDQEVEGEWSIRGILNHTARAEWWYLDRLDLAGFTREDLPPDRFARLERVRARLREVLPQLEGVTRIEVKDGETWSPRKLLRRALWHERDHTQHILQFRARLGV
jgi:uncharacterized damage-inducible protein DinB/predicted RNase H-like HicB family nuclease